MKKILLSLGIIFLLTAVVNAQGKKAENPNAPKIKFEKLIHDYGKILKNGNGKYEFKFTNEGKEPLILSRPRSSCGCTVPTWPKKPILPGKSEIIEVTYATNRVGAFMKTVTIMSNAKNPIVVLKIKGEVVNQLANGSPTKNGVAAQTNK